MADDKTKSDAPAPVRRTRTAEAADAIGDAADKIARFSPQQVMHIIFLITMLFGFGMMGFSAYAEREDRKSAVIERQEHGAAQLREFNSQSELMRQHCNNEVRQLREYFATQSELQRKFEADQRDKDRTQMLVWHTTMVGIGSKLAELERHVREKKVPEE